MTNAPAQPGLRRQRRPPRLRYSGIFWGIVDVTCERCGTEYEFDETLLSGRGTTVKCTNCGHVFRVYPSGLINVDRATSNWKLRHSDSGRVELIESLRDLQHRISEGQLSSHDEICRGDQAWKPLGAIAELETFFVAARNLPSQSGKPAQGFGKKPRQKTLVGAAPIARTQKPASDPAPQARRRTETVLGHGAVSSKPPPVAEGVSSIPPRTSTPTANVSSTKPEPIDAEFTTSNNPPASNSSYPPAYIDDDDELPTLPNSQPVALYAALIFGMIGALIWWQWPAISGWIGLDVEIVEPSDDPAPPEQAVSSAAPVESPLEAAAVDAGVAKPVVDSVQEERTPKASAPAHVQPDEKAAVVPAKTEPPPKDVEVKRPPPKVAEAVEEKKATPKPKPSTPKEKPVARESAETETHDALDEVVNLVDGRPSGKEDYGWYVRKARAALAGGQLDRARVYYESALESRPGSGEATLGLGKVALKANDTTLAMRYFRSATQRGYPAAFFNLGDAYQRLGSTDLAIAAYYTYTKRVPGGPHTAAAERAIKQLTPKPAPPPVVDADEKDSEVESEGDTPTDDKDNTAEPNAPSPDASTPVQN